MLFGTLDFGACHVFLLAVWCATPNNMASGAGGWDLAQDPQPFATQPLPPTQIGGWIRVDPPIRVGHHKLEIFLGFFKVF